MRKLLVVTLLLLGFEVTAADNLQCIQQPKRIKACPHLLYRVAQLPDMVKADIVCICVADFYPLFQRPATEAEQITLNMTRRQYQSVFGNKLEAVLDIIQPKL